MFEPLWKKLPELGGLIPQTWQSVWVEHEKTAHSEAVTEMAAWTCTRRVVRSVACLAAVRGAERMGADPAICCGEDRHPRRPTEVEGPVVRLSQSGTPGDGSYLRSLNLSWEAPLIS